MIAGEKGIKSLGDHERKRQPARHIGEIVADWMAHHGYANWQAREACELAWQEVVGPALGKFTRTGKICKGTLEVTVENSAIVQELVFQKRALLSDLVQKAPEQKIQDLKFRVGPVFEEPGV